jgi:hypothetical protein
LNPQPSGARGAKWKADSDINIDGVVDIYDALILAGNYGRSP